MVIATTPHHATSGHHHHHHHVRTTSTIEQHRVCENWSNAIEALASECSLYNHTLQCYGGVSNLHLLSAHRLRRTEQVIFCGWPNTTFDSSILKLFPKVKVLRIENSNLTYIDKDFPQLMHLQVSIRLQMGRFRVMNKSHAWTTWTYSQRIKISWTNLKYAQPTVFGNLPTLKSIDLRWNKLQHMGGPFMLPSGFTHFHLAGENHGKSHTSIQCNCCSIRFSILFRKSMGLYEEHQMAAESDQSETHCWSRQFIVHG